jgi:hypothetical protein
MKITRGTLKQLIKEELNEMEDVPGHTQNTLEHLDMAIDQLLKAKDLAGVELQDLFHRALGHLDEVRADLTGI